MDITNKPTAPILQNYKLNTNHAVDAKVEESTLAAHASTAAGYVRLVTRHVYILQKEHNVQLIDMYATLLMVS